MSLTLITDRTASDVAALKAIRDKLNAGGWSSLTTVERATWLAGKGAYNATDLARVESAVSTLTTLLRGYGYRVDITTIVTSWTEGSASADPSEFNAADASRYLSNLVAIKAAFYGTTPLPAGLNSVTVEDLNNMERLLLEIEDTINRMAAAFRYCGELIIGEDQ